MQGPPCFEGKKRRLRGIPRSLGTTWRARGNRNLRRRGEKVTPFSVPQPRSPVRRTNPPDLQRSRHLTFTSHAEGFGVPPLAAIACRTAVVSTRVGGVPDYGTDGETILLAEPRDLDEMARQVSQLIGDPDLRETMSREAEKASKEFTWDSSVEILERILLRSNQVESIEPAEPSS
ncbi:MAG: glycosyltransferase family 4 protein [Myxococcales bacterium]|nr:glycosyltransferase family 4 protein [Myxococcales bacterium]